MNSRNKTHVRNRRTKLACACSNKKKQYPGFDLGLFNNEGLIKAMRDLSRIIERARALLLEHQIKFMNDMHRTVSDNDRVIRAAAVKQSLILIPPRNFGKTSSTEMLNTWGKLFQNTKTQ